MMRHVLVLALLLSVSAGFAGCAKAISANPIQDVSRGPVGRLIATGIQDAVWNLEQAVGIGVLPVGDPALTCLRDIQTKLGLDPSKPPAPSFVPKRSDLISEGSIVYIRLRQLKAAQAGGLDFGTACEALVGRIILDAIADGKSVLPGGGLLPRLR